MLRSPRSALLGILLLLPNPVSAGEPWEKKPEQWSPAEVNRILTDSPWSPGKTKVEISMRERRVDLLTKQETDSPIAPLAGPTWTHVSRSKILPDHAVLWWSAKTVRLAQQRFRQIKNRAPQNAPLAAEDLESFVIVVEGAEPLRILRDAEENLRESVFLELPTGMSLDVADIRFVEGQAAGEDYVAFHFPRQADGHPTITPDTERVAFHCKATAKTARPGQPNSLTIRAEFSPRKMRVGGHPDF